MRLNRPVLLAFNLSLLAFGQPAGAPKLGADAPTMGYREVPEWPAPVLNAAGTRGGPWNFIQVSSVAVDAQGHILVLHRDAHKGVAGAGHDTFNLPTDVAFAPNGDFYISDGYAGNLATFSRSGLFSKLFRRFS